ncbi:MAG: glycosyl hydrolase 115 family protein [Terriglobales bacterium]
MGKAAGKLPTHPFAAANGTDYRSEFVRYWTNMKLNQILRYVLAGTMLAIPGFSQSTQHRARAKSGQSLTLTSSTQIVLSSDEPIAVQNAAKDLASDFEKVFGSKPSILAQPSDSAGATIIIGEQSKLPESIRPSALTAPESFSIAVANSKQKDAKAKQVLVLAGADVRGTMYAVYQFSEQYLGIDPLYYWTDHDPLRRTSLALPASLQQTFAAPLFKYRGFFINDEDLLTGWAPGEKKDGTGISLEVWNRIFETILRLKGNIVMPGTWIFPDEPQVKLAATRGLIVSQHHAIPLGLNVARWPKDVPYNYTTHPEILERAWRNAVNAYAPNQEVLWTVGLRGLSDVTYASMDPSVQSDNQALGRLVSKAIADQMQIVRSVHPDAKFITNLWQEGARLVQQGALKIPADVSTVWADDGYGYIQDKGEVATGQGAYYHVAMMNGRANQLTEMVPVERIMSELGRYIKAGATHYLLLNTSDIRPVPMTIKAVMDFAWRGLPPSADSSDRFYHDWSAEQFGEKAADKIAQVYKDYFTAPAHLADPVREYGDQLYHTEARRMLLTYMTDSPLYALPSQSPKWQNPRILSFGFGTNQVNPKQWLQETVTREIQQCGEAESRWDKVWNEALEAESLVVPERRQFYQADVLTMITINRQSNRILLLLAKAIRDEESGQTSEARSEVQEALQAFGEIQQTESAAEYGKWKNWYQGDWLTGIYRTRELVEVFSNFLDNPETHLSPPVIWDGWEAYYHIMHYEADRSAEVK